MNVEIRPEPTPEEREALLAALSVLAGATRGGSAWWEAGLLESLEENPALPGESPSGLSPAF